MSRVSELNDKIRDLVNEPRQHSLIRKDGASFNMLCSCMDTIGDTQLTIDSYPSGGRDRPLGESYLMVYGILQVLVVQQDAVRNMMEALGLPELPSNPALKEVRRIRNDSIGHPSKSGWGRRFNFMTRPSISAGGFDLMTLFSEDRSPRFQSIKIKDLTEAQGSAIAEAQEEIIRYLEAEKERHMDEFRGRKLASVFPETLDYCFQKVFEACRRSDMREFGVINLDEITESIDAFKAALAERNILDAYDGVVDLLDQILWPLARLREYFNEEGGTLNERSAHIFATFCKGRMNDLRSAARMIDSEYEETEGSPESA